MRGRGRRGSGNSILESQLCQRRRRLDESRRRHSSRQKVIPPNRTATVRESVIDAFGKLSNFCSVLNAILPHTTLTRPIPDSGIDGGDHIEKRDQWTARSPPY